MMRKYYEEKEKGGAMKYIVPFLCVIVLIEVLMRLQKNGVSAVQHCTGGIGNIRQKL